VKATFPVEGFAWKSYTVPLLLFVAAVVASVFTYDGLPDAIPTHFNTAGEPNGWMKKLDYTETMLGTMFVTLSLIAALDALLIYPNFPVPIMSLIAGAVVFVQLITHLGIIGVLNVQNVSVYVILPVIALSVICYIVILGLMIRPNLRELPQGAPLWVDNPPRGWFAKALFFVSPIMPKEVIAYEEGLIIKASTYTFAVPWKNIRKIVEAGGWKAVMGMAVRVVSDASSAVRMEITGMIFPLIFSAANRQRLIEEWKNRRGEKP
jgi:hypothetical protein